jgi:uncharacterized protein (TIGR03435 family)
LKIARRLDSSKLVSRVSTALLAVAVSITLAAAGAFPTPGQAQAGAVSPTFDVASVKVNRSGSEKEPRTRTIEPGKIIYMNATLSELIEAAYGVKHYQVTGPDWILNGGSSERYDVLAEAGSPVPPEEVRRMLASLLAERFHLTFHRETRDLPVFALVVAKGGPKIKPGGEDSAPQSMSPDGQGGFIFKGWTMATFATWLTGLPAVGRPVIDQTGLEGPYSFDANLFNLSKDASIGDAKRAMYNGDASDTVFAALQSELGLKLVAQKAMIDVIVIDHAERVPTEN